MKPHKILLRPLAAILFAITALSAQEKVAVLPPQGGRTVSEINKKTVRSAFLDYLSAPGSGYQVHDRNATDLLLLEPGGRLNMLYDEKYAMELGKTMGVTLVCIIDLTREENNFLIECKLINVETGLSWSESEIVPEATNTEIKKASEAVVKKLMAKSADIIADSPATLEAAHAAVEAAMHERAETKTTPVIPAPLRNNIDRGRPKLDFGCFAGVSVASVTGDFRQIFDEIDLNKIGFGISLSAEMKYFRLRTEGAYFSKARLSFSSFALAAEGMYRFGSFDRGLYVFGGAAGATCSLKLNDVRVTGNGVGISGGFGYNFNDTYGIEASYTSAANVASYYPVPQNLNITQSINLELIQVSFRYRF